MESKPIYTVTTLRGTIHDGIRCVGFAHELQTAIDMVEDNSMDINECKYYWYVVIEKVLPGFYSIDVDQIWFKWDVEKDGYQKLDEKPEQFKRICGFGIG